jgi:hypothetical protein
MAQSAHQTYVAVDDEPALIVVLLHRVLDSNVSAIVGWWRARPVIRSVGSSRPRTTAAGGCPQADPEGVRGCNDHTQDRTEPLP